MIDPPNAGNNHGKRKEEHLDISLNENVQFASVPGGFDSYYFIHQALPEIDLADVDLSVNLFGKKLNAPLVISSMVGGIEAASTINRNLATAAQELGLAMGVGSQRCLIDSPLTVSTFRVRDVAPDILLFANLGAVLVNYGFGLKECLQVIATIQADALILHLNPLQEALQPGGNTNFRNLVNRIAEVCKGLPVPVIIKEVGAGISEEAAAKLAEAGVAGIDVAGAGGTCWSDIERRRNPEGEANNIAAAFADWGIPTAESILMTRRGAPGLPLIAGGGIRNGMDSVKAIALGADAVSIAMPLLKPSLVSSREVETVLAGISGVMKIAMFCLGIASIPRLKGTPLLRKR